VLELICTELIFKRRQRKARRLPRRVFADVDGRGRYEDRQALEDGRPEQDLAGAGKDEQKFPTSSSKRAVVICARKARAGETGGLRGRLHQVCYVNGLLSGGKLDRSALLRSFPISSFPLTRIAGGALAPIVGQREQEAFCLAFGISSIGLVEIAQTAAEVTAASATKH